MQFVLFGLQNYKKNMEKRIFFDKNFCKSKNYANFAADFRVLENI